VCIFHLFKFLASLVVVKFVDIWSFLLLFFFFARVFWYLYVSYTDQLKCANMLCRWYAMPMIPCWCICIWTQSIGLKLAWNSRWMKEKNMLLLFISVPNRACASLIKDVKVFRLQTLKIFIFLFYFFAFLKTQY
jgi:hypothetical protein